MNDTQANIVDTRDDFENGGPGTVMLFEDAHSLAIKCPGCGEVGGLRLDGSGDPREPGWKLVGEGEKIGVKPSLRCVCGFHGWLLNGTWQGA